MQERIRRPADINEGDDKKDKKFEDLSDAVPNIDLLKKKVNELKKRTLARPVNNNEEDDPCGCW